MKKITLSLFFALALSFVFTNEVIAQTLNQNATWPNVNWTISGTFTETAGPTFSFEANPTVDANFAFDDDDAGNGSDDSIAAESPVIDVTAAFTAGETLLTVNVDYVYRKFSVEEFLRFQYYDADTMMWVNWEPESMPGNDNALTDDFCAGTPIAYTTVELDIAGFTATQQSGFQYRILFDDDPNGAAWEYGFCLDSPTITSVAPLMCTQAIVNSSSIVNDCDSGQFQLEVDVDSVGDGAFINDGTNTFAIVVGINLVGPYASGTNVTLTIEHSDSACDFTLPDVSFTCPTIPVVNAVFTINGCLDLDIFSDNLYDASVLNIYWAQLDYDGGCFELTVDTEGGDFDTEIGLYNSNGFLIGNDDDSGTDALSTFTEVGLPAGTYYIAAGAFNMVFGVDNFNVTSTQAMTTGSLWINARTPSDNTVDFCNLQFPFEGNIQTGQNHDVFTQVYEAGITEPQGEQGAGIVAWIGVSETDATTTIDFTSGDWTWVVADYNATGPASNNDEYSAEIGSARTAGVYYYVSRYSIDGGPFAYGGINPGGSDGNFWDGTNFVSGELTVTNPPPPANDACVNAIPVNDGDSVAGSTDFATNVEALTACEGGGGSAVTGCAGGTGIINFGEGVWYVYSAGPDVAISVTTDNSPVPYDTEIQVFSGDCSNLVCVGGDDDGGDNAALSTFCWESSAAEGTTVDYYIYVDGHAANTGDFLLDISVESTLSISDFENQNTLTYFPNPVKNILTLRALQNIQSVSVLNILGQKILKTTPNALENDLDMSGLNTGSYFVKVTINDVTETIRIIKN